jgi:hypothetical protein
MLDPRLFKQVTAFNYTFFEVGRAYKITFDTACPCNDNGFGNEGIDFPHGSVYAILVKRSIDSLSFRYVYRDIEHLVNTPIQSWINFQDYIKISKLVEE